MNILFYINFLAAIMALTILVWKRHWVLAATALCCVGIYGYGLAVHGVPTMDALCDTLINAELYNVDKAIASSYGAIISLIMTSIMMGAFPWLKRWTIFVWFAMLLAITTYVGITSSLGIAEGLYGTCGGIMTILSQMLGMTYMRAC